MDKFVFDSGKNFVFIELNLYKLPWWRLNKGINFV
jgi:hypothetical protein